MARRIDERDRNVALAALAQLGHLPIADGRRSMTTERKELAALNRAAIRYRLRAIAAAERAERRAARATA